MPAPKKPGSARRAPATNKDGTVRKKPGPAKGTPRGAAAAKATVAAEPAPKLNKDGTPRKKRGTATKTKKTFLIYSVDGNELSFAVEHPGATGQIAVAAAVKAGVLSPDTPYVFLTPATIARAVEIEAVERDVQYKVKAAAKKRRPYTRKAKVEEPTVENGAGDPVPETPAAAPASARKKAATLPPSPGATTANPFA